MTYRSKENVVLPLYVQTQIHFNKDGGSVSVMLGLKGGVTDKPVEARVTIPFSLGKRKKKKKKIWEIRSKILNPFFSALASSKIDLKATYGKVSIDEAKKTCVWDIGRVPKDSSPHLEGKIHFAGGVSMADICKPAIQVEWHCIGFLCSGLEVDSLNVANTNYSPFKGVKTLTKAGAFEVRS